MRFLGIVAAKSQSLRFPGKNRYKYRDHPLFWHSVEPLVSSQRMQDVIVTTNCSEIANYCKNSGVEIYERHINAIENEAPLIEVLKQVCLNYPLPFDYVVTIMANCPGHTSENVHFAVETMLKKPELNELRSFDKNGDETGLMIFKKDVVMKSTAISSHIGSIQTNGFEVHYEKDFLGR